MKLYHAQYAAVTANDHHYVGNDTDQGFEYEPVDEDVEAFKNLGFSEEKINKPVVENTTVETNVQPEEERPHTEKDVVPTIEHTAEIEQSVPATDTEPHRDATVDEEPQNQEENTTHFEHQGM